MWDELENALAWYAAAPNRWVQSAKQDMGAAAQWIWEVIQGDFNDEQSTAQIATGMVISMIPFVDQLCDVRDVVANCRNIHREPDNNWHRVALVLTLIGLFPVLGSLAKGCFKILFAYARKGVLKSAAKTFDSDLWKATQPMVERGIVKLNEYLARPEVRKALAVLHIDNPYKYLATKAKDLAGQINANALKAAFDEIYAVFKQLVEMVQKWGTASMQTQAGQLLKVVAEVRNNLNAKLADVLAPVQHWLNKLARRLEVEGDMNYRAYTNAINAHSFTRPSLDAEIEAFKKDKPAWVDVRKSEKYKALDVEPVIDHGYPDITATSKSPVLKGKFDTFHDIQPMEISPGTVLYRVVDPGSFDNSICWMTKAEFDKLKSKDDWRRYFAVWANWNSNGEFVTYTVPPGKPLKVWEGKAASQKMVGTNYYLEGGARQIVLDPAHLDKGMLGKRQPTNWGYSSFGETLDLVGVPTLKNYWFESKK